MTHLGDITKIHGGQIEPVDCITGGSPCQDLSVAGKRAGLAGERSGLFMDQVRIVKEMREADVHRGRTGILVRPRYMVWENVPGAFSSNKGHDFRAVLEEIVRIIEPECPDVPMPEKGKWPHSGCLYDDMGRWSIAWRLHDAQFWGVPQRRRRIALVADFGGLSAPEILFERKGLSGYPEPGRTAREETAGAVGGGIDNAEPTPINTMIATRDKALGRGTGFGVGEPGEAAYTISAAHEHAIFYCDGLKQKAGAAAGGGATRAAFKPHAGADAGSIGYESERAPTIDTGKHMAVYDARGNGNGVTCPTITGDHENRVTDYAAIAALPFDTTQITSPVNRSTPHYGDPCHPLAAGAHPPAIAVSTYQDVTGPLMANSHPGSYTTQDAFSDMLIAAVDCRNGTENPDINGTLQAKPNGGQSLNLQNVCRVGATVRRLTPLECERLQGYPDGWTDIGDWTDTKGKKHKAADSPRYKALGNSIALPFWRWLIKRISAQYERDATLGSLFDGIGGFPYCWERANGKGSARWASEIEEFPIAVTKIRFGEE